MQKAGRIRLPPEATRPESASTATAALSSTSAERARSVARNELSLCSTRSSSSSVIRRTEAADS
jgi:hypothetical protein